MRQQAADLFTAGVSAIEVAAQLEVSPKSAYAWRRAWKAGGSEALQSKGTSGARSKLSDDQMRRLQQRLEAGPAASGYVEDQRWTLPRVVKLIATICHVQYSIKGASLLLHRMGWTPQMPSHRAVERDEAAIISWRKHNSCFVVTRRLRRRPERSHAIDQGRFDLGEPSKTLQRSGSCGA